MTHRQGLTDVEDVEFFFQNVVFKAESTLFCVPREYLPTEGGIFESMFSMPNLNGEGTSREIPIVLPAEVTAADFRGFLKACLPKSGSFDARDLTAEEWMSVLKLSATWCLDELRLRAIENADAQVKAMPDVVDRVLFAKRYKVSRWLIDGYETLAKRAKFLSVSEQTKLGSATVIQLSSVREESWSWFSTRCSDAVRSWRPVRDRFGTVTEYPTPSLPSRDDFDYRHSIGYIFLSELLQDPEYVDTNVYILAAEKK